MQPPPLKVDIRQDRDLGEVFNATFAFIRQNLGVLVKGVLFFVAPLAALSGLFAGQYLNNLFATMTELDTNPSAFLAMLPLLGLGVLFSIAAWLLLHLVVLGTVKLHEKHEPGVFSPAEALKAALPYFWPLLGFFTLLGAGFMVSIMLNFIPCLGTVLWLVGIVYVGARLSLTPAALVLDGNGLADAMRQSWTLVSPAFWQTLGVLALMFLIAAILGGLFSVPYQIFVQVKLLTATDPMSAVQDAGSVWMTAYLMLATVAQQLLYVLPLAGIGVQYGNLSETLGQAGLLDRLRAFSREGESSGEGSV